MQWGTQSSTSYPAKCLVFVGYSLTDEDFVHIYDLVRQRLADTPRRPYIVTLDERINGDTHPDAKVILTSGDRFLARIKFAAARYMLADDRYDEVTLELRALASAGAQPTAIDGVTTPRSSTPFLPGWTDARPATSSRPIQDRGTRIRPRRCIRALDRLSRRPRRFRSGGLWHVVSGSIDTVFT